MSSPSITSNWSQSSSTSERNRRTQYFKEILRESGLILTTDSSPNVLTQEQALVIRDLEKNLEKQRSNIEKFKTGLNRFCTNEEYLQNALMPSVLHKSNDSDDLFNNSDIVIPQDSAFRIMLNVDCLQEVILELLLENLLQYATEEKVDEKRVPLILNSMRYLPYIKKPDVLSTKLLDILEVANYDSQLEILYALPEIIPDMQYDDIAKQLGIFLDENSNLAGAVVECLSLLQISSQTKADIQDRILAKLFTESYFKIFPILYEFLITDSDTQTLQPIFIKIRKMLDSIFAQSETNAETETNKTVVLTKLQSSALSSKIVYDAWLTLLSNIRNSNDHTPFDILMLFVLHSTTKTRRSNTETLFKKKIKNEQIKTVLLETFFEKYVTPQFLKDQCNTFLDVALFLLQNSKTCIAVRDFASALYREIFLHKNTDCVQHQEIIHNLIFATSTAEQEIVSVVLKIFSDLLERDFFKLQKHTLQIMILLEKLDVFELKEVKETFEILCALTCGTQADDSSGLKDEIHMIIRKQLSSAKKSIKHRGIIAAVVMAKNVAITTEDQSDLTIDEDNTISIADLPNASSKEAAGLLNLTNISSSSSSDSMCLFYDELASMLVTTNNLDKYFLVWMKNTVTNDFQNTFIAENVSESINDIPLSIQYSLVDEDEMAEPIYVNIAEVTLQSKTNQILILSPMFRLLRLLHFRQYDGDLSTIDALLCCGVVMPKITDNMDSDQIKQSVDCVFHCANWFRENISAFVTQKTSLLRKRVIERLKHLLKLERILQELMLQVPEHKLPTMAIDLNKKQKAEGKKPPKSKEIINDTTTSIMTTTTNKSKSSGGKSKIDVEINFREMDTDVMLLLKYPVIINENSIQTSQNDVQLDLKQFCYVLKDVIIKLEFLVQEKQKGLSLLNVIKSSNIIKDFQHFLPNIRTTINNIQTLLTQELEENENSYESPNLFTEETQQLKVAFGLILHCITLIFSWRGFQDSKNLNLLRSCLKSLHDGTSSQLNSVNCLTLEFARRLYQNYIPICLCTSHAVEIIKIMQAFHAVTENEDLKKMIVATAGKFLKRQWYSSSDNSESGKLYNLNLSVLLKAYLNGADVKTVGGLIGTLQKQAVDLKTKDDSLPMLGSINKSTLHVLFQALCGALLERVRSELISLTNHEHLILWKTTGLSLQGLMSVVQIHETRVNLVCFLKKSLGILKLFLNQGIPILEIMLKAKPDDVVDIFKIIQSITRFLHHLCCHSKLTKDTSLIAYVPQFRLTLETLVYRVKAALVANNCTDAFWMGNLRNRDLHGEHILTQDSNSTDNGNDEDNEEDEDVLPEDEDSDSEFIGHEEKSSTSASEVI